jgi:hypothetical protein
MKALVRGAVAATALLVLATGATAEGSSLTITSPAPGSTVSRAAGNVPVTGTFSVAVPEPDETTFFLRRGACASGDDDARLSREPGGASEVNGCAFLAQPANEVLIATDQGLTTTYAAEAGSLPVTLDATRDIAGNIRLTRGVGLVTVEATLTGTLAPGGAKVLGTRTTTYNGTLLGTQDVRFDVPVDDAFNKADVTALSLSIRLRGVNGQAGVDNRNGVSFLTLPTYTASFGTPTVQVSTSATFPSNRTVTATLSGSSWSASVPLPAGSSAVLYARLRTGALVAATSEVPVTIAP